MAQQKYKEALENPDMRRWLANRIDPYIPEDVAKHAAKYTPVFAQVSLERRMGCRAPTLRAFEHIDECCFACSIMHCRSVRRLKAHTNFPWVFHYR